MRARRSSAAVFAALGDEARLGMVARLCREGPLSIARLTAGTGITRQAVTKHLSVMGRAGLVKNARHGRESVWQLRRQRLEEVGRYLETISRQWDAALERLREFVEE